jgi:polyhydroxyalkanoate synthesis regulator phasin
MPQPRQSSRKKTTSRSRTTPASKSSTAAAKDSTGVREQLARFLDPREVVVLTRERVQEAVDDAVERGRMTRNDATALVTALFERGKTQTDDLISQIEGLVTGTPTRIVREVDRARRATGIGSNFPISGYDDLTAAEVGQRLSDLSPPELRKVRDYERRNANRKSVLQNIERKLD